MPAPYVLDERAFAELKRQVQQQRYEISSLRRHLQHVSVRRHQAVYRPASVRLHNITFVDNSLTLTGGGTWDASVWDSITNSTWDRTGVSGIDRATDERWMVETGGSNNIIEDMGGDGSDFILSFACRVNIASLTDSEAATLEVEIRRANPGSGSFNSIAGISDMYLYWPDVDATSLSGNVGASFRAVSPMSAVNQGLPHDGYRYDVRTNLAGTGVSGTVEQTSVSFWYFGAPDGLGDMPTA